jgi:CRISPR-associated endonuclease/helicase Cas3
MVLYPYQERVKNFIQAGRSVILQAPTGSGKTRAALAPYIEAFYDVPADAFPRRCIYSVPMRVLANQFHAEYMGLTAKYQREYRRRRMRTTIQTGEQPEDPRFLGDLIFATIDQSLSSALAVPYSLSPGMGNLNAGAFFASYLVFDEFHLFPIADEGNAEGALTTTLQLLTNLRGIVPFVLMTATFSSKMLQELAYLLEAEVVQVPPDEYLTIASGNGKPPRSRRFKLHEIDISADEILLAHQSRSIAVCNQVQRAQDLFQALRTRASAETEIQLLHSRFTPEDRRAKEEWLQREFGQKVEERQAKSAILVATQVVEVGLDITSENLHTEIAPANAVFQRAGRCARYPGEQGVVHIYDVPMKATRDGTPKRDFLPYPAKLCESTWTSLTQRDDQVVDFTEEQRVIDEVHTATDRKLLASMERQATRLRQDIETAMDGRREFRSTLIRRIDNVTVLATPNPDALGDPFRAEGFGLWRGTVKGILGTLNDFAMHWAPPENERDWLMRLPGPEEGNVEDPTQPLTVKWSEVNHPSLLDGAALVVVNSAFCAYDAELGFRIVPPGQGGWASPPGELRQRNSQNRFSYQLESYAEHIERMISIYERSFADDYAYVQARIAHSWGLPPDALDRGIRLAIALHDLAKMDERWQRWVRLYQEGIGESIADSKFMAVHTHWSPDEPAHRKSKQDADRQCKRPPHAGESAVAGARIVDKLAGTPALGRAVATAISRHHSASTGEFGAYRLHAAAADAATEALRRAGFVSANIDLISSAPNIRLDQVLVEPGKFEQMILYFWVVRALRLCDALSQSTHKK